jgi:hypothetical protein
MAAITLDAGGLIALDKNRREVIALLARAAEQGYTVVIPAGALAQAMRRPDRQARLSRLIRQPRTVVVPLDRVDAIRVGRLLAVSGTADVVDAHVVECARRYESAIVTSDPDDLRALDDTIALIGA